MSLQTALFPLSVQNLSISGTNASSTVPLHTTVRLVTTTDCYVAFGSVATTSSMLLLAGVPEYFETKDKTTIQAITSSASGTLNITLLA